MVVVKFREEEYEILSLTLHLKLLCTHLCQNMLTYGGWGVIDKTGPRKYISVSLKVIMSKDLLISQVPLELREGRHIILFL